MPDAAPLHMKHALVVGASRGLGLGLAREFARRGWRVSATARDAAPALREAAEGWADGRLRVEHLDVDDAPGGEALAARLRGGRLDLVLLNAGVLGPRDQSVDTASAAAFGALLGTNALAPVRLARRLLPLVADGGTIAFVSSRLGSVAETTAGDLPLYRASKAALNSLSRGFAAAEAAARPVAVLSLHPGWVRTAMGGEDAPLSVEESARGLADVIEAPRAPGHHFLDHRGEAIAW